MQHWYVGALRVLREHGVDAELLEMLEKASPIHRVPEVKCTCGFYAYYTPQALQYALPGTVFGVIEAEGRVQMGTRGFRAERACIKALVVSRRRGRRRHVAAMRQRYPDVEIFPSKRALLRAYPVDDIRALVPDAELDRTGQLWPHPVWAFPLGLAYALLVALLDWTTRIPSRGLSIVALLGAMTVPVFMFQAWGWPRRIWPALRRHRLPVWSWMLGIDFLCLGWNAFYMLTRVGRPGWAAWHAVLTSYWALCTVTTARDNRRRKG